MQHYPYLQEMKERLLVNPEDSSVPDPDIMDKPEQVMDTVIKVRAPRESWLLPPQTSYADTTLSWSPTVVTSLYMTQQTLYKYNAIKCNLSTLTLTTLHAARKNQTKPLSVSFLSLIQNRGNFLPGKAVFFYPVPLLCFYKFYVSIK